MYLLSTHLDDQQLSRVLLHPNQWCRPCHSWYCRRHPWSEQSGCQYRNPKTWWTVSCVLLVSEQLSDQYLLHSKGWLLEGCSVRWEPVMLYRWGCVWSHRQWNHWQCFRTGNLIPDQDSSLGGETWTAVNCPPWTILYYANHTEIFTSIVIGFQVVGLEIKPPSPPMLLPSNFVRSMTNLTMLRKYVFPIANQ